MKRTLQKFRLYLAGIALLVGGGIAWASTSGPNVWAEKLQSLVDNNKSGITQFLDAGIMLAGNADDQSVEYAIDDNNPLITSGSQFSSPYSQNDWGATDGGNITDGILIDNDASTFWHSVWSGGSVEPGTHYFQVELPENALQLNMAFRFTRRRTVNDQTTSWSVCATNDSQAEKDDCLLLATIETPYNESGETLTSSVFNPKGYKFLRFYSEEQSGSDGFGSRGYFHLAEFQLYPVVEMEAGPLPIGEYYFKTEYDADNDGTAETYFLGGANNWGTRAALIPNSVLWTLEHVNGNIYRLDSYQSNGGTNHYLGSNDYVDTAPCNIYLTQNEADGTFTLSLEEQGNYLKVTEIGFHKLPALGWGGDAPDAIKFNVISKNAEIQPGDNVTYLIRCANFDVNNRYRSAWTVNASNYELNGGEAPNRCAESWHSAFNIYQTIQNVPNGIYVLGAQAAVRDDAERWDGVDYPVVYINEASTPFLEMENRDYSEYVIYSTGGSTYYGTFNPAVVGSASMGDFSQMFAEGMYSLSVPVNVTDGTITLGIKGTRTDMWAMFDNFSLVYYGYSAAAGSVYLSSVLKSTALEEIGTCNAPVKEAYETAYAATQTMAQAGTASYQQCVAQGDALMTAYNNLLAAIAAYKSVPDIINDLNKQLEVVKALDKEALTEQATTFIQNFGASYEQRTLTTEDITSAKQNFKAVVSEALTGNMEPGDDLSLLITNPTFDTDGTGWTVDGYATVNYSHGTAEVYHHAFDYYQVIPSAAPGIYRLSCTAFNRVDGRERTSKLYGGISEERLKLLTEEGSPYALLSDTEETGADGSLMASSTGTWPYDTRIKADGQVFFNPNSMEGANIYFNTINPTTQLPYYTVSTQIVQPEQGDLRIGIKCESTSEWVLWDNFKLEYVGSNEDLLADYVAQLKAYLVQGIYYQAALRQEATTIVATAESGTLSEAESYNVIGNMGNLLDNIKASVDAYATLTDAITAAEDRIANAKNINEQVATQLQTLIADSKNAINAGSFTDDEAKGKATQITELSRRLQSDYLIIEMAKAGTLGDLVLDLVENFSDVKGLTVIGPMNSRDISQVASMSNLEDLDLTDAQLERIENSQFSDHDVLKTVRLPKTLRYLGSSAFNDCDALVSVTIAGNITNEEYYDDNGNYYSSTMGSYIFSNCDALEEVIVEEGVKSISNEMFQNCYRLSKLTLPLSLTAIRDYAFYNCYSLASIPLPGNLEYIGSYAFYRNNKDRALLNGRYEYDEYGNYLGYRYDTIPNLSPKQIEIPSKVTSIGYEAFYNFGGLESVTLNEGLTSIEDYAFYNTAIRTATFPSTLASVGNRVFNSGTRYTSLALAPPTVNNNGCPVQSPDTLFVPMLVTKAYKQASGWNQFKIVGADIMPNDLVVRKQMNLDFATANIPEGYKPNVKIMWTDINQSGTGTPSQLGALEVHNGGTFSVGYLEMNYSTAQSNYYRYNYRSYYGQAYYTPQYSTLITDGSMRADNITIRVSVNDGYWSFISLPYDVRVGDITCETEGTDWVIRRYDGEARAAVNFDNTWVNMGEEDILEAGKGYIIHCSFSSNWYDYRVFQFPAQNNQNKNLIFSANNRTIALNEYQSEYAHNRSWNLIGNPYPAYMDITSMNIEAPITVWNGRDGYIAYSPIDDDFVLSPGEAFFVQRPLDQGSITFQASARKSYYDVTGYSNYVKPELREANSNRSVFNLFLSDGEHSDRTRVVINPAASMDYESNCDASLFPAMGATAMQLYSIAADVQYAINERPLADGSVQLAAHFGKAGTYTLSLETRATESVILIDELTGTTMELNGSEGYTFTAEAGTADKRFRLQIAGKADAIESLMADDFRGATIFTLDGKRLPAARPTATGIYLVKKNGVVRKVSVK